SYTNEIKAHLLSVEQTTLDTQGAVSSETASEMALGARKALNVGIAVSVTGIAGPTGAEPGKPVGTVWLGLSTPSTTKTKNFLFDGNREEVRRQTCEAALNALLEGIALMQS
ncbi:MAG: CinA family protein, partial [Eggerthellaceae bacterium]